MDRLAERYLERLVRTPVVPPSCPRKDESFLGIDARTFLAAVVRFKGVSNGFHREAPSGVLRAVEVLRRTEGVLAVVLYGSRARGDADPDSDWDFFVFCRRYGGRTQEAVLDAQGLGESDGAFFMPGEIEGRLNLVFAEEVLLSGRVIHVSPGFLRGAAEIGSEEVFQAFFDPRLRYQAMLKEVRLGVRCFEKALEEVREQMELARLREYRPFWPPFGLDWVFQDLKRAVRCPAMGLAFWLRPRFSAGDPPFLLGRKERILEVLAREGWVPAWSRALYEHLASRLREIEEPVSWMTPPPFPPGEFVRLAERTAEHLAFVTERLGLETPLPEFGAKARFPHG
ncbi:nucleotidyltransferase domain-containing protein [Thermosulfurimonas sp. F29]|uniref:nucleotidyltransferase domain-containing protein n=1 Tax=Thermosulfurimonas sp. F29 TaxID=2867247 RepID=UPI001C82A187|nr:nucleotidyltransferase domain-containing protein [Thermosulfurimonas sp. F29]MBX6423431.1 nucleotidyltransferase domain-containing protein [Thermosulfurimonas sp. F29]